MWSLCWEIGSTVPIQKSVANLSKLSYMLCSKLVSFQSYLLWTSSQQNYHLWTSIVQQNSQHLILTFRRSTSQTLLLLPWGPDATWTKCEFFPISSIDLHSVISKVKKYQVVPVCWHSQHKTTDHNVYNDDVVSWRRRKPEIDNETW